MHPSRRSNQRARLAGTKHDIPDSIGQLQHGQAKAAFLYVQQACPVLVVDCATGSIYLAGLARSILRESPDSKKISAAVDAHSTNRTVSGDR